MLGEVLMVAVRSGCWAKSSWWRDSVETLGEVLVVAVLSSGWVMSSKEIL
jgi:hypothetical protein